MARRGGTSIGRTLRAGIQTIICALGLLGGLVAGAAIVYFTGLWFKFGNALRTPFDAMANSDLLAIVGTIVIVFGCGWIGARWGMARAARVDI